MDEARRVLERLERIRLLEREGVHPRHVLAEVRALLGEAEEWMRAERTAGVAAHAVERCRRTLEEGTLAVTA